MIIKRIINKTLSFFGYKVQKISLRKNAYLGFSRWEYQRDFILSNLPNDGIILDIGSGHNPIPRANLLADFFPKKNHHRAGKLIEDRPVIICSVDRIPILSKKIEFVICSHVLEHVVSPVRAGNELGRIAKSGYIETPAYGKDILMGTGNTHRWQVVEFDGIMHFFEYSQRQKNAHTTSPVMKLLIQRDYHEWQDFFWSRQDLFNAIQLWEANPQILEFHRNGSKVMSLIPWRPVTEADLTNEPVLLTETEIEQLNSCLSTPDGLGPMNYSEGKFVDITGKITYPVRGKKIYFEIAE